MPQILKAVYFVPGVRALASQDCVLVRYLHGAVSAVIEMWLAEN